MTVGWVRRIIPHRVLPKHTHGRPPQHWSSYSRISKICRWTRNSPSNPFGPPACLPSVAAAASQRVTDRNLPDWPAAMAPLRIAQRRLQHRCCHYHSQHACHRRNRDGLPPKITRKTPYAEGRANLAGMCERVGVSLCRTRRRPRRRRTRAPSTPPTRASVMTTMATTAAHLIKIVL